MNMHEKLLRAESAENRENRYTCKASYVPPKLVFFGSIRNLTQGGGKSGSNADSDPISTTKRGTG